MSAVEAGYVSVVLLMMLTLLFYGWKTPEIVVFLALVLVWNVGTISTSEALSGFNNQGVLAVGSLFIVIKGVERSQLADKAAKHVFGLQTSFRVGLLRLMVLTFVLSAFFNNTPIVALLIPITRDWAHTRGFSPSKFLMPLSFSCIFGGVMTIIGTSTNLLVAGLVVDAALQDNSIHGGIGFFEPGYIGLPLGIVGMVYLVLVAPLVLSGNGPGDGNLDTRHRAEEYLTEIRVMRSFEYLQTPVAAVLARLGMPTETLIKIRRKGLSEGQTLQEQPYPREDMSSSTAVFSPPSAAVQSCTTTNVGAMESELSPRKVLSSKSTSTLAHRKRLGSTRAHSTVIQHVSPRLQTRQYDSTARISSSGGDDNSDANSPKREHHGDMTDEDTHSAHAVSRASPTRTATGTGRTAATVSGTTLGLGSSCVAESEQPVVGSSVHTMSTVCVDTNDSSQHLPLSKGYVDIYTLSPTEVVKEGDELLLSCPRDAMIRLQGSIYSQGMQGLSILNDSALGVSGSGTEFFEVVLSEFNPCGQKSPNGVMGHRHIFAKFSSRYNCGVVAVRHASSDIPTNNDSCVQERIGSPNFGRNTPPEVPHKNEGYSMVAADLEGSPIQSNAQVVGMEGDTCPSGNPTAGNTRGGEGDASEVEVSKRPLSVGDFVLVLADDGFMKRWNESDDFDLVSKVGSLPKPVRRYDYLSLVVFCGMLGWVLFSSVIMVRAAMTAGGVLIIGGWVDARKAVGHVDWALLLLVGSALGLSKAISNSGLADYAGEAIRNSGMSASTSIYVLYGFTMVCTELITNNAAAALACPVALSIARELEADYKPFVLTVMIAASSSFITPIGYQTNTMVWAPGGYKFSDFIKLGTPLSLLNLVVGSFLMPYVFPF